MDPPPLVAPPCYASQILTELFHWETNLYHKWCVKTIDAGNKLYKYLVLKTTA